MNFGKCKECEAALNFTQADTTKLCGKCLAEVYSKQLKELDKQRMSEYERHKLLDDGFVALVDHMGTDQDIVDAARVSYQKGTTRVSDDRGLIRYLMRHRHTTPLEMVEFKFLIRCPMDLWRQWIRHRTANVNEYSTRYSEAIESMAKTEPDKWRLQSKSNKQGSSGFVEEWPEGTRFGDNLAITPDEFEHHFIADEEKGLQTDPQSILCDAEEWLHRQAKRVYLQRLSLGVAREQARKDLPLSNYTEAYWKIDLHNLFHFLGLRMDNHAQWEIRQYANKMFELIQPIVPIACEAFQDYRLNAVQLSALEIRVIQRVFAAPTVSLEQSFKEAIDEEIENKREKQECRDKLVKLGFEVNE